MNFKAVRVVAADCRTLPYADIDYAAHQSRPVMLAEAYLETSFTQSWFVPQEFDNESFKRNQQQPIEPGHVLT